MTRATVGAISAELAKKAPESRDPIELQREMQKHYIDELSATVQSFREKTNGDFFVVVLTRKERLMPNVLRNQFFGTHSCPTPNYDQAVYHYVTKKGDLKFIWQVPDRETCFYLKANANQVEPAGRELLQYVLDFADGTLYAVCKKLNGESKDSPLLQQG